MRFETVTLTNGLRRTFLQRYCDAVLELSGWPVVVFGWCCGFVYGKFKFGFLMGKFKS